MSQLLILNRTLYAVLLALVFSVLKAAEIHELLYLKKVEGTTQLFSSDLSLNNEKQLTFNNDVKYLGLWAGDNIIYYERTKEGYNYNFYNVQNQNKRVIKKLSLTSFGYEILPEKEKIVYNCGFETGSSEIRICSYNGDDDQLLFSHRGDHNIYPCFNPADENMLAYVYDDGNWSPDREVRIRYLREMEDEIVQEANNRADGALKFSPDGRFLAWNQSVSGYIKPYVITVYDLISDKIFDLNEIYADEGIYFVFTPENKSMLASYRDEKTKETKVYRISLLDLSYTLIKTFLAEQEMYLNDIR